MRVPYSWIQEFVRTKRTARQTAAALTLSGSEVVAIERVGSDSVLDLDITPNRSDCLSVIGVAREVAAVQGLTLRVPTATRPPKRTRSPLKIRIQDTAGCSQYIGRLITGVTVQPSPAWMQRRLMACGIRPINNIVDITNYVLLEYGQPLHAFDWSTIRGGNITVRRATSGERMHTLDDTTARLTTDMLVIADDQRPIAIAGIMGGRETAITERTTDIVLESAQFAQRDIRMTARAVGLHSDSSYRFERGVDPVGVARASARAAALIHELAGGQDKAYAQAGTVRATSRPLAVIPDDIQRVLGVAIPKHRMKKILQSVGCTVRGTASRWSVQVPSFRLDMTSAVDCAEEVARLYGYDNIPSVAPTFPLIQQMPMTDNTYNRRAVIHTQLVRAGLTEAVTWSLVSEAIVLRSGMERAQAVRITNPLSQEQAYLRPALWPRIAECVATNLKRHATGVALFEIGQVHSSTAQGKPLSAWHVAIACAGVSAPHWTGQVRSWGYASVTGMMEALATALRGTSAWTPTPQPSMRSGQSAAWSVNGQTIGFAGAVDAAMLKHCDVKQPIYVAECTLEPLTAAALHVIPYQPLPKVPSVERDVSFVLAQEYTHADVSATIRQAAGPHLMRVRLVDRYDQPPAVPQGSISMTYNLTFQHPTRTLTDEDANQAQQAIIERVTTHYHATVRTA